MSLNFVINISNTNILFSNLCFILNRKHTHYYNYQLIRKIILLMDSNLILPYQDSLQENNPQTTQKITPKHKFKLKPRIFCYGLLTLVILISLTLFVGTYFYATQPQTLKTDPVPSPQTLQHQTDQTVEDQPYQKLSIISDPLSVRRLVVQEGESLSISSSEFPNLKQLVINNPSLRSLEIDPELRLQELVINSTQLTTFSYNSSQLQTLKLINNTKMTTFCKSIMPSLEEVYIIQTNISDWYQNSVGKLSKLHFIESSIRSEPQIGSFQIKQLYLNEVDLSRQGMQFINKYNFLSIVIGNIYPKYNFQIYNPLVQSISFQGSLRSAGVFISGCTQLRSISISQAPLQLRLSNLTQLENLQLNNISQIQILIINNVKEMDMPALSEAYNLRQLSIQNTTVYHFGNFKSELLSSLILDFANLKIRDFNFSFPALRVLEIVNYESEELIDIVNPEKFLKELIFRNVKVPEIKIDLLGAQYIVLRNVTGLSNQIRLNINLKKPLSLLSVNNTNITEIGGWNISVSAIYLGYNQRLEKINLPVYELLLYNNPLLNIDKVQPQCHYLRLYSQSLSSNQTNIYFPNLENLEIHNHNSSDLVGYNLNSIYNLQLVKLNFTLFQLNSLPSLEYLFIQSTSVVSFQNNYLPSLQDIYLRDNPNLDWSMFVNELASLKSQGTNLNLIRIPSQTSDQIRDSIREVFPNIKIYDW